VQTLQLALQNIPICPELNPLILKHLKNIASSMSKKDSICIFMWDKKSIQFKISYDIHKDIICGLEGQITRWKDAEFISISINFLIVQMDNCILISLDVILLFTNISIDLASTSIKTSIGRLICTNSIYFIKSIYLIKFLNFYYRFIDDIIMVENNIINNKKSSENAEDKITWFTIPYIGSFSEKFLGVGLQGINTFCDLMDLSQRLATNVCYIYYACLESINLITWYKEHEKHCVSNHTGSAGKMEVDGVIEMFARSEILHEVKYINYIGDGDTKTVKDVIWATFYYKCSTDENPEKIIEIASFLAACNEEFNSVFRIMEVMG
ncbi:hypothetical protein ALC53_01134, partial [Atta colombica]